MIWVILCGLFGCWVLFLLIELLFFGSTCRDTLRSVIITLILMGVVLYFAESYWKKTHWVSVDAVVVKQEAISKDTFDDDLLESVYYDTTYEVVYRGKTYLLERTFAQSKEAGETVTIDVNPDNPADDLTLPTKMWIYSLLVSTCVLFAKWLTNRIKERKEHKQYVKQLAANGMKEKNENGSS